MTQVFSEMTRKVIFARETDDLRQAYMSMRSLGVRHVPVVRDKKLVGILSIATQCLVIETLTNL